MLRERGWRNLSDGIENDLRKIYSGAALTMYDRIADRDDSSDDAGSPLASGRFSASVRIGLDTVDRTTAPDTRKTYHYPPPSKHLYNRFNLPRPVLRSTPRSVVKAWLRPFKLGQTIHISNAVSYAITVEDGRRGKVGSWQKPKGVFKTTLAKLFQEKGWY